MTSLAITVDVDGEAGLPDGGRAYADRLSSRSERTYGVLRGLPRILGLLDAYGVVATFYVPGLTALRHPEAIHAIASGGHELGHHGHTHRRPDTLSPAEQREEILRGVAALSNLAARPRGYRAPGWELTPVTVALLAEHGFEYDSSLMGDDRPYTAGPLVELPVHWSLDDAPYFEASPAGSGLWDVWRRELELAADERRAITLTLHPEILGRPHRADILRRVLDLARELGFEAVTHGALAAETIRRRTAAQAK
ncbi:polysaccharide deacetylase family protein [Solirubrobacter soli]|uniref:polysaccharide deacetylase family protein n=1 Tax=Solirubrobacter soli TaxID=363832 RepID=UPI0004174101|nr:polysaccharide deacetylase family protein [Solirubrobacter soli]